MKDWNGTAERAQERIVKYFDLHLGTPIASSSAGHSSPIYKKNSRIFFVLVGGIGT